MTAAIQNTLPTSIFVARQLPEFVREEDPLLVSFMEAYYTYLSNSNTSAISGSTIDRTKQLLQYQDIDTTINSFSEKLYNEFMAFFPKNALADRSLILKNVLDFYRARGTTKSYKFLFRALFGKEADIYTPRDDVLIASSGKWFIEKSIRVSTIITNSLPNDTQAGLDLFVNTQITGITSTSTAFVERVLISFESGVQKYEIFISNQTGAFLNGESITATDINGNVLSATILSGIIASITITKAGSLYNIGDPLVFTGGGGNSAAAAVSQITTGSISSIVVNYGGAGFLIGDQITFTGGGGTGANANVLTLAGTANSFFHPNTYNIFFDPIGPYLNTNLAQSNYGFPSWPAVNMNTILANAWTAWNYGPTGPIQTLFISTNGSGYLSTPTADVLGNTVIKSLGILGRLNVVVGGTGYANGDVLQFFNPPGGSGFAANGTVLSVNASGGIERVGFQPVAGYITGGAGYDINFLPKVNIATAAGTGGNVQVTTLLAHGAPRVSLTVSSGTFGAILAIALTNKGQGYTNAPNISLTASGDGTAQAYCNVVTGTYTYPGRYLDDTGFPSGFNFLQDRDYYQNFSYVIKVKQSIEDYRTVVRNMLHPTGMKLWGNYILGGDANSNVAMSAYVSTVNSAPTS